MSVNWNSVVEGATAGIAASVILGVGALSRKNLNDFWFRRTVKREFRLISCNVSLDGITVALRNHSGKAFTVHHLAMITDCGDFRFDPLNEVTSSFKGQHPKPSRSQLRALKSGRIKEIPLGVEYQYRVWRSNTTREGFVTIEPFTSIEFLLPYQLLANHEGAPAGFRITIEYEAWPQKRKIWQLIIDSSLEQARKTVERAREQLRNGTLNETRAKLGKPPIAVKSSEPPTGMSQ